MRGSLLLCIITAVVVPFFAQAEVPAAEPSVGFYAAADRPFPGAVERRLPSGSPIYLEAEPSVTPSDIACAQATENDWGQPAIHVGLTEEGGRKMEALTRRSLTRRVAVVAGGEVVVAPLVQGVITRELQLVIGDSGRDPGSLAKLFSAERCTPERAIAVDPPPFDTSTP